MMETLFIKQTQRTFKSQWGVILRSTRDAEQCDGINKSKNTIDAILDAEIERGFTPDRIVLGGEIELQLLRCTVQAFRYLGSAKWPLRVVG